HLHGLHPARGEVAGDVGLDGGAGGEDGDGELVGARALDDVGEVPAHERVAAGERELLRAERTQLVERLQDASGGQLARAVPVQVHLVAVGALELARVRQVPVDLPRQVPVADGRLEQLRLLGYTHDRQLLFNAPKPRVHTKLGRRDRTVNTITPGPRRTAAG